MDALPHKTFALEDSKNTALQLKKVGGVEGIFGRFLRSLKRRECERGVGRGGRGTSTYLQKIKKG